MSQYATFYLNDALFGINILHVRELNRQLSYTPVPDASEYIKGLLNLRGQVVTIFDLAKRLGYSESQITDRTRNMILRTDNETAKYHANGWLSLKVGDDPIGFLIDEIGDVVDDLVYTIQPIPANLEYLNMEYITGVIELEKELLVLINIEKIFEIH